MARTVLDLSHTSSPLAYGPEGTDWSHVMKSLQGLSPTSLAQAQELGFSLTGNANFPRAEEAVATLDSHKTDTRQTDRKDEETTSIYTPPKTAGDEIAKETAMDDDTSRMMQVLSRYGFKSVSEFMNSGTDPSKVEEYQGAIAELRNTFGSRVNQLLAAGAEQEKIAEKQREEQERVEKENAKRAMAAAKDMFDLALFQELVAGGHHHGKDKHPERGVLSRLFGEEEKDAPDTKVHVAHIPEKPRTEQNTGIDDFMHSGQTKVTVAHNDGVPQEEPDSPAMSEQDINRFMNQQRRKHQKGMSIGMQMPS